MDPATTELPVVATATASGKSLCYKIPAFENALESAASRALFLYPTKALAQDQMGKIRAFGVRGVLWVGGAVERNALEALPRRHVAAPQHAPRGGVPPRILEPGLLAEIPDRRPSALTVGDGVVHARGDPRAMVGDVSFHVLEFADERTLADLGMEDPFELTGLYTGVPVGQRSVLDGVPHSNRIFLYRQPILAEWCETPGLPLGELVAHVLIHEIAHHFGLSDAQIHAIEDAAEREDAAA